MAMCLAVTSCLFPVSTGINRLLDYPYLALLPVPRKHGD